MDLGVDWTLPGRKRRFATTTVATSDLVVLMAEEGHTVSSAISAINFDEEAIAVLRVFVEHGYGERPLSELVG